ncbi:hypothetical protein FK178_02790 [Antarcticibacterium arcticum]|uniref:Uncharacterized protein n=1 Tax=Antarcticibacterium arcticum TaxID=2585771 RepID=A0A5B8YFL1_9FLAO|nr:hypothetical protein [Antarcticibacterium arcticum]QED36705.1 hypothetical protein FK178_02790 [Antarcticibacterium arcticum]
MKIVGIFAVVENALLSVQYNDGNEHEFARVFKQWSDLEYLEDFFETHRADLQSEYYRKIKGLITVEQAVLQTLDEAEDFEYDIKQIAETGKGKDEETLHDYIFHPLHKNDSRILHQESKAYGSEKSSWLRLYAIRIAPNLYVISGGAIKLTKKMQERDHTALELKKLKLVEEHLKTIGFEQADDYGFIEIGE